MKVCASCGYRCEDNMTECPNCADAQFLHLCPQCLTEFSDDCCPKCGIRYDAVPITCPTCGEQFFGEGCSLCGYMAVKPKRTMSSAGGPAFPGPARLTDYDQRAQREAELGVIYAFLGLFCCGLPIFTIPALIHAFRARKMGDTSNSLMITLVISTITVIELIIVLYFYWPILSSNIGGYYDSDLF